MCDFLNNDKFWEYLMSASPLVLGGVFILAILTILVQLIKGQDFGQIFNIHKVYRVARLKDIENFLGNKEIADPILAKVLCEERDTYYFEVATGIFAEKHLRDGLIGLHKKIGSKFNWKSVREILKFIVVNEDGKVGLRALTLDDKIDKGVMYLLAGVATLYSFLAFTVVIFSAAKGSALLTLALFGSVSFIGTSLILRNCRKYIIYKKVNIFLTQKG